MKISKKKFHLDSYEGFSGRIEHEGNVSYEAFVKEVADRSSIKDSDVDGVVRNIIKILSRHLSAGRNVDTKVFRASTRFRGRFDSLEEGIQKNKHRAEMVFLPGRELKKEFQNEVHMEIVRKMTPRPEIYKVVNHSSGSTETISPGDLISINGLNLKFENSKLDEGLFLEGQDGQLRVQEYSQIGTNTISCKLPIGLQPGDEYQFLVKSRFGTNLREGRLESVLTCQ